MPAPKNVLLIVVDQWRGLMLPKLGADYLKVPNIDRLCEEGVTFRNHFTQTAPCGPARASLLTSLYQINHRAVQNTIPLDARFTNLGHELRKGGYDAALVGYTTTTPDPRTTGPNDPRFLVLGDIMDGFRPVGAFEPYKDAYFGWVASQGYKLPENCEDIWLPEGRTPAGEQGSGATARPSCLPKELSDTAWFTERGLTYLRSRAGKPWFLHLGYYRPHPPFIAPAPYHAMYRPEDMPKVVRAASAAEEASQHPLLGYYVNNINQSSFFQDGKGLGSEMTEEQVAQMRATYCGLMSEVDDQLGRVFDYLKQSGQWDDTLIVLAGRGFSLCRTALSRTERVRSDLKRMEREPDGRDRQGPARSRMPPTPRRSWHPSGRRSAFGALRELADATVAKLNALGHRPRRSGGDRAAERAGDGDGVRRRRLRRHHGTLEPGLPGGGVRLLPLRPAGQGADRGRTATRARRSRWPAGTGPRSCGSTTAPDRPAGWFELTAEGARRRRRSTPAPREEDDEALVLHTSGTTSRPKIVPLLQRNLAASARHIRTTLALTPDGPLPQRHAAVPHPRPDRGRAVLAVGRRLDLLHARLQRAALLPLAR